IVPLVSEAAEPGFRYRRIGSAFLIAPDVLATSFHTVIDAEAITVVLPDGQRLRVRKAWALDPVRDVALLYIDPKRAAQAGMQPLPLAPMTGAVHTTPAAPDSVVFTYGWPGGVQRSTAGRYWPDLLLERGQSVWV